MSSSRIGLLVDLGQEVVDLGIGEPRRSGARIVVGIVVARLDALKVEDGEPTEPGQFAGHPCVDDRVHRGGEDRDGEVDAAEGLGQIDVGRLDRVGAGGERDILEAVGRPDGVDLGMEDAARRRGGCLGSLDHVALLCPPRRVEVRLTVGCPAGASLPRVAAAAGCS